MSILGHSLPISNRSTVSRQPQGANSGGIHDEMDTVVDRRHFQRQDDVEHRSAHAYMGGYRPAQVTAQQDRTKYRSPWNQVQQGAGEEYDPQWDDRALVEA